MFVINNNDLYLESDCSGQLVIKHTECKGGEIISPKNGNGCFCCLKCDSVWEVGKDGVLPVIVSPKLAVPGEHQTAPEQTSFDMKR